MKPTPDPLRLLDPRGGVSGPARTLLEGGRRDVPTPADLARLAQRLPLGSPPAGGGGSAAPGSFAPPSLPVAPPLAAVPFWTAIAGPALGVAVALGAIGAALLYRPSLLSPPGAPVAAASLPATAPAGVAALPPVAPDAVPVSSPEALPSPTAAAATAPAGRSVASTTPGSAGLGREVDLLQRAQAALGGDPARALAMVQEQQSRFPAGALVQEREVVAVGALVGLGRVSEARARAARFVAQFPRSAYRRRIEALVPDLPRVAAP